MARRGGGAILSRLVEGTPRQAGCLTFQSSHMALAFVHRLQQGTGSCNEATEVAFYMKFLRKANQDAYQRSKCASSEKFLHPQSIFVPLNTWCANCPRPRKTVPRKESSNRLSVSQHAPEVQPLFMTASVLCHGTYIYIYICIYIYIYISPCN